MELLSQLLNSKHGETQVSIMSLVAECCRSRPEVVGQKIDIYFREELKERNILQQVIRFLVNDSTQLAQRAAETILCMFDGSPAIYNVLLKHKGMATLFKAVTKFK